MATTLYLRVDMYLDLFVHEHYDNPTKLYRYWRPSVTLRPDIAEQLGPGTFKVGVINDAPFIAADDQLTITFVDDATAIMFKLTYM